MTDQPKRSYILCAIITGVLGALVGVTGAGLMYTGRWVLGVLSTAAFYGMAILSRQFTAEYINGQDAAYQPMEATSIAAICIWAACMLAPVPLIHYDRSRRAPAE